MPETPPRWKFTFQGTDYVFDVMRDLTASRVRQLKVWYGPEIGRVQPFIVAMIQGDPDAWACAIWCARKQAGEVNVPEPKDIDFSIWELMSSDQEEDEAEPKPEAAGPVPTQTPGSSETSSSSETSTSDS